MDIFLDSKIDKYMQFINTVDSGNRFINSVILPEFDWVSNITDIIAIMSTEFERIRLIMPPITTKQQIIQQWSSADRSPNIKQLLSRLYYMKQYVDNPTVARTLNNYASLFANSLIDNSGCEQIVLTSQEVNIRCTEAQLIAKRNSIECKSAILNDELSSDVCNSCNIDSVNQDIIVNFTANCLITNYNTVATSFAAKLRDILTNNHVAINGTYLDLENNIVQEIQNNVHQITQALILNQNITMTNANAGKKFIGSKAVISVVLNAFLSSDVAGKLDDITNISIPNGNSSPPTQLPPQQQTSSSSTQLSINMYIVYAFLLCIILIFVFTGVFVIVRKN
jgi:hypothetical protein